MENKELSDFLFPNIGTKQELEEKYPKRKDKMVTRFAPSPTGFLHIGSLYTAFVSKIFAQQNNGVFYLRIEDTDQKREIENGISLILNNLNKFEINPDEGPNIGGLYGPYIQSDRKEIYQIMAKNLIYKGLAYPCFMTEEELKQMRVEQELKQVRIGCYGNYAKSRNLTNEQIKEKINNKTPYVIRLRSTGNFDNKFTFHDEIKGDIIFPLNDMDVVLIKQDGLPTYHFAHIVDDYLMGTTDVIRGDEWLSSVPIHYEISKALDIEPFKYAHLSPLTIKDGKSIRKLSKRKDKECKVEYYEEEGIPNMVIKLYFASIINSSFDDWYMNNHELNDFQFELSKMSSGGTLFDLEKMKAISKLYFSRLTALELYDQTLNYMGKYDQEFYQILKQNKEYSILLFDIERGTERCRKDIASYLDVKREYSYMYDEYFLDPYCNTKDYSINLLEEYLNVYSSEDNEEIWLDKIKALGSKYGYATNRKEYKEHNDIYKGQFGDVCEMIRVALTGQLQTPNLYYLMKLLKEERVQKRIKKYIQYKQ